MIKSVILTSARSGSNLLKSLLNSHPDFYFHGEVFNPSRVNTLRVAPILTDLLRLDPTELRDRDPLKFVDIVYALSPSHFRSVGFKLFLLHDANVVKRVLNDKDIRVVMLDRPNRLASYSSKLIGEQTGVWWVKQDDSKPEEGPVKVKFEAEDFDEYRSVLDEQYRAAKDTMGSIGKAYSYLDYPDLMNPSKMDEVAKFLGAVRQHEMKPDIDKQNTNDLLARFINPDDVKAHLSKIGKTEWFERAEV